MLQTIGKVSGSVSSGWPDRMFAVITSQYLPNPGRFKGHLGLIDRFLGGLIQPPDLGGALAYMGLSPEECGQDATGYAWAQQDPADQNGKA